MASVRDDAVFDHDLDDDDETSQSLDDDLENDDVLAENDDELEDEEDINAASTSFPATVVPVAVPSASMVTVAVPNGADLPKICPPEDSGLDVKRQRLGGETTLIVKKPQPQQLDDSRRGLFQRLWTDEDEIELLQGFLEYTAQRGTNHHDTALFYDQIKSKLQLDFNKNQLVEKLRRLKKKYRNVLNKISSGKDFSFKSPHDHATFEISRKIWSATTGKIGVVEDANLDDEEGNPNPNLNDVEVKIEDQKSTPRSRKRPRSRASGVKIDDKRVLNDAFMANIDNNNNNNSFVHNNNNNTSNNVNVLGLIEETVKSCLSPLFKELLSNAAAAGSSTGRGIGGLAINAMPLSFSGGEMMVDEKWRKQQILELEVYSKRLELVQDQIRAQLEELRSMDQ